MSVELEPSPGVELRRSGAQRAAQSPGAARRVLVLGAAALIGAVSLAVVLWPRPPLWLDEAQSVAIARRSLPGIVDGLRADGAPPIYYFALHVWMRLFGDSDTAVRSLSVLCALAAAGVLAIVARRALDHRAAPIVVLLLTVGDPYFVRYATEARMYALVMLEVGLGALALEAWLRTRRRGALVGIGLVAFALPLTHYWGLAVVVASGATLAVWSLVRPGGERRSLRWAAGAAAAGLLATAFWWPVLAFQSAHTGTPWTRPSAPLEALTVTLRRGIGHRPAAYVVSVGLILLAGAGAVAAVWRRAGAWPAERVAVFSRWVAVVLAGTWVVAYAMSRATESAFVPRYTMIVFPLQLLLATAGALWLAPRRAAIALAGVVWLAGTTVAVAQIDEPRTRAPEFADVLEAEAGPGDVVLSCPDQLGPPLARLLEQRGVELRQWVFPTFASPVRVDWIDYRDRHERASASAFAAEALRRAEGQDIWLLVSLTHPPTETACAGLVAALRLARPGFEVHVPDDPRWRDHDSLLQFPPAPPR